MKTVVITGAASGLGWALTERLFAAGERVLMVDRDARALTEKSSLLAAEDERRVACHLTDLTDQAALDSLVSAVLREERLDVLINNAGITHRSPAARTELAVFRRVMAVDWEAPVALTLALLPKLRESRGSIVNIGSMAGWMPVLGRAGYCSAKAAMAQFFEVLRAEVLDDGVHVLMVYPSFLATPIETNALGGDGKPARHARSSVGKVKSAGWMADGILEALAARRERLFPDRFTALSGLLYRIAPRLYHRLMRRRFAVELDS